MATSHRKGSSTQTQTPPIAEQLAAVPVSTPALTPPVSLPPTTQQSSAGIATAGEGFTNSQGLTTQQIMDLQHRNGLPATGIIGPQEAFYLGNSFVSTGTVPTTQPTNNNPATNGTGLANHVTGQNAPPNPLPIGGQIGAIPGATPTTNNGVGNSSTGAQYNPGQTGASIGNVSQQMTPQDQQRQAIGTDPTNITGYQNKSTLQSL